MTDQLRYISDKHERNKNPKDDSWKKGPKITLQDCLNGSKDIEKTTLKDMLGDKFVPDDQIKFGKHRGQLLTWVKENDEGYWNWCVENVPGFDRIAKDVK